MVQHRTGSGRLKVTRSFVAASRVASCARSVAVARREVMLSDPIGLHTRMPLVSLIQNAKKRKKKKRNIKHWEVLYRLYFLLGIIVFAYLLIS